MKKVNFVSTVFYELKKMCRNRAIRIICVCFLLVAILDPISVRMQDVLSDGNLLRYAGKNPFQFWLLINSVSWGNHIYYNLLFVLCVLFTGLIFYREKSSSMLGLQIIRMGWKAYYREKVLTSFLFPFACSLLILGINVIVTYLVFPEWTEYTGYYQSIIPQAGTFSYGWYQQSPLLMAFGYVLLNALGIGLLSLFALGIHMALRFPNQYVAVIVPVIVLYLTTFVLDGQAELYHFDIRLLMQPTAAFGLVEVFSARDVIVTFLAWSLVDLLLIGIGLHRNRDILS